MSTTSSTNGSAPASNNNANATNNAPALLPTVLNTDYTKSVNFNKAPFDGTEYSLYLRRTQIVGFAETYNYAKAILGTSNIPKASAVLSDADYDC
jgi:hypothetical protein